MKIPETVANVGAYYGNEGNGQWQPNGVIIDSGVGGGVVGSGDAGVHRPPVYPVQIPRGHIPGPYVMAGAYYPPGAYPPPQDDFADYMWMENEEEFDKQVMQQLEEEALMEQCIEAMLEDEQREQRHRPSTNGHTHCPNSSSGQSSVSLEEAVSRSTLNPLAAEFVPNQPAQMKPPPEEPQESVDNKTKVDRTEEVAEKIEQVDSKESIRQEEPPQPVDPPEVSAADIQPIEDKDQKKDTKKDSKKPEVSQKKIVKTEVKKTKPIPPTKDVKVQKKKETKKDVVKEDSVEVVKQPSPPPEDSQPGFKPINYAAAAKAMKPKQKPTSPTMEQPVEKPKTEKAEKKPLKDKPKLEKPNVQRKNSAK